MPSNKAAEIAVRCRNSSANDATTAVDTARSIHTRFIATSFPQIKVLDVKRAHRETDGASFPNHGFAAGVELCTGLVLAMVAEIESIAFWIMLCSASVFANERRCRK